VAKTITTPDATPAAEAPPVTDYLVTSRLDHDGVTYLAGQTVSLNEAHAKPLLGGCIAVMPAAETPEGGVQTEA
jgi:hypothetical protein